MGLLISILITFLVIILVLYLINMLPIDGRAKQIVRVIVMLAHNLGLKVVAEGVETPEQMKLLNKIGCDRAQGYLFARPADQQTIGALLAATRVEPVPAFLQAPIRDASEQVLASSGLVRSLIP